MQKLDNLILASLWCVFCKELIDIILYPYKGIMSTNSLQKTQQRSDIYATG